MGGDGGHGQDREVLVFLGPSRPRSLPTTSPPADCIVSFSLVFLLSLKTPLCGKGVTVASEMAKYSASALAVRKYTVSKYLGIYLRLHRLCVRTSSRD